MTEALKRTPLFDLHISQKAKMVPFGGWEMPVQYQGILAEAKAVRSYAGMFDVSHMGRLYISGSQAPDLMDWLLTAPAANLNSDRARYGLLCNEDGGIIDDTVFYRLSEERYLLVCNASNRPQVVPWIRRWAEEMSEGPNPILVEDATEATVMIALQGPTATQIIDTLCPDHPSNLRHFSIMKATINGKSALISRTGYTGEDGFEMMLSGEDGLEVWQRLLEQEVTPCGLGARDVLRLEAGLMLHGNDINGSTTPLEAGLERFVRLARDFVGAQALRQQQEAGVDHRMVGLLLNAPRIARHGYLIRAEGATVGHVTSGTYSPTLDRSIALGYVSVQHATPGHLLQLDVRGKEVEVQVTKLPFYSRKGTP